MSIVWVCVPCVSSRFPLEPLPRQTIVTRKAVRTGVERISAHQWRDLPVVIEFVGVERVDCTCNVGAQRGREIRLAGVPRVRVSEGPS
jgi:hypothetical protein